MIKNIILTGASDKYNNLKAVVTFENTSNKTLVTLKNQNFLHNNGKLVLGVKTGGEYFKVELINDENYLINKELDLNKNISVAIVKIVKNDSEILVWGSNETTKVWKNSILDNIKTQDNLSANKFHNKENLENEESYSLENKKNNATNFLNEVYKQSLEDDYETDEYIEELINNNLNEDMEEIEEDINLTNNKSEFLNSVEGQINELLNTYESENALEELILNSKFVKVNVDKTENFYVFGVIYENNEIKYIVYGLPGEYSVKPDDEYKDYYQWLPLNSDNPEGYGYYLMYQDALNGNQVEMVID